MQEQTKSKNINSDGNQTGGNLEDTSENKVPTVETEQESDGKNNYRSENSDEVYNAKRAAIYLNRDEKTVRNWIKSGRLSGQKIGGRWQVTKAELDAAFVEDIKIKGRETERGQIDTRSSKNSENKKLTDTAEQETERKNEDPTPTRSDTRYQYLEAQIEDKEKLLDEKDQRIDELKSAHEKAITEREKRINDKADRINDLKADRKKDEELYSGLLTNAQQLIQSLQSQVVQLEAPKQPQSQYQEVEAAGFQETEQGSDEQEDKPRRSWWPFSKNLP